MNEKTVIDFLALQNPWWEKRNKFPFSKIKKFKRSDYSYLLKNHMETKEALVIVGPRGVGKSTIFMELIRNLLGYSEKLGEDTDSKIVETDSEKKIIDPKRVVYLTFDERKLSKIGILEILKIYIKYILRKDISELEEKIYIFLDEIQNVDDWGSQIKIIQDLQYPIKIFISGSSSVAMHNEASKATRRLDLYSVHPLKFSDYLRYKLDDTKFEYILNDFKKFREDFINAFQKKDTKAIYDGFLILYSSIKPWQTQIELVFQEYIIKGGYPGLLKIEDYGVCATKLRTTFWLGFHKDVVLAKGIGDPSGMRDLIEYIATISSQETNYTSLIKKGLHKGGTTANTEIVKRYLYHLEMGFLVKQSHILNVNPVRKSSSFKIYLTR